MTEPRAPRDRAAGAPSAIRRVLTAGDVFLIVLLVGASVAAAIAFARAPAGATVSVRAGDEIERRFSLSEPRTLRARGPLGETEIAIEDGAARVVASPCARKVCVRMGAARRTGETLVCVPNRVIVRIEANAGEADEFDAILR